jgi:two-component system sensor histidine kinase DesK
VADSGGELTVHHDQDRFTTAARFPHPAPAQPTTTWKDYR